MHSDKPVRFVGGTGSPYTQKMVALMRYRRIPYAVTWGRPAEVCDALGIDRPKPVLMPTFFFDEEDRTNAVCDSTPLIRRLEGMYAGRSVVPEDPALAFIDYLIEDFADEWGTKYMFHYRWYPKTDAANAAKLLPLGLDVSMPREQLETMEKTIGDRQIGRLYVVGSNEITAPIIDASFRRFLNAMEAHLANQKFMLGARPGVGDFGLFGQLTQLIGFEPTPREIAHELSPRTVAWVDQVYDQSGLEPVESDWISLHDQPESLRGILAEIGRVYVPAQLANASAVRAGEDSWECEIDGETWTQPTFPYQAKCLQWTNEHYEQLSSSDRDKVNSAIEGTGIEDMLFLS